MTNPVARRLRIRPVMNIPSSGLRLPPAVPSGRPGGVAANRRERAAAPVCTGHRAFRTGHRAAAEGLNLAAVSTTPRATRTGVPSPVGRYLLLPNPSSFFLEQS
ncbi:hypothetical protein GCM10022284_09540 [Streptomyces hundungensis]